MAVVSPCREMLGHVPPRAQPSSLVASSQVGTPRRRPVATQRKAGGTTRPHGPYVQGDPRATMAGTKGRQAARWSKSQKAGLSSDWSLQRDSMKLESLVIAYQHDAVNTFPGLVHTARHTTGVDCT